MAGCGRAGRYHRQVRLTQPPDPQAPGARLATLALVLAALGIVMLAPCSLGALAIAVRARRRARAGGAAVHARMDVAFRLALVGLAWFALSVPLLIVAHPYLVALAHRYGLSGNLSWWGLL